MHPFPLWVTEMTWGTLRYGAILVKDEDEHSPMYVQDAKELKSTVLPTRPRTLIRQQGERPTCVAMAGVTLADMATGAVEPLSAEHLYYLSKARDGVPTTCGTYLRATAKALADVTLCTSREWSYYPRGSCHDLHSRIPPGLNLSRRGPTLMTCAVPPRNVLALKQAIASGLRVACTFQVFASFDGVEASRTGEVPMPGPHEVPAPLGHAGVLWGYVDDNTAAGGGYFVFQNSRGLGWGSDGRVGGGHGTIPYEYLCRYGSEAVAA